MAMTITDVDRGPISLTVGKEWSSFEQFRTEGTTGIRDAIKEGTLGLLRLAGSEYVLLNRRDFERLYGLAGEVRRLSRGALFIRQAVELVRKSRDQQSSWRLVHDLALEFSLPTVSTTWDGNLEIDLGEQATSGLSSIR